MQENEDPKTTGTEETPMSPADGGDATEKPAEDEAEKKHPEASEEAAK